MRLAHKSGEGDQLRSSKDGGGAGLTEAGFLAAGLGGELRVGVLLSVSRNDTSLERESLACAPIPYPSHKKKPTAIE